MMFRCDSNDVITICNIYIFDKAAALLALTAAIVIAFR